MSREWFENLPSPYAFNHDDIGRLVAAVHEYECLVIDMRKAAIAADSAISHLHYRHNWPLDDYETDRLIAQLRKFERLGVPRG